MPKKKRRKTRTTSVPQTGGRAMLPVCVRAVTVSYLFFIICSAVLTWVVFQKETPPTRTVQIVFLLAITVLSFLLCGWLSARKNTFSVLPICFFSGFTLLVLLTLTLLLASKGSISVFICVPIGIGLICPIAGGILGKRF